jgi:hypothetical protein
MAAWSLFLHMIYLQWNDPGNLPTVEEFKKYYSQLYSHLIKQFSCPYVILQASDEKTFDQTRIAKVSEEKDNRLRLAQ